MSEPKLSLWLRPFALWFGLALTGFGGYLEVMAWTDPLPERALQFATAWMLLGVIALGLKALYCGITGEDVI